MLRGLYTAYTGMKNEERRMDVIANNMANANTNGYKAEGTSSRAFSKVFGIKINDDSEAYLQRSIGKMSLGVKIGESYRDWSSGSFRVTDNTYDFAIAGNGFFTISMTDRSGVEHIRYTRDGAFTITSEGYLVTKDGDFVLDDKGGKIQLPTNQGDPSVDGDGNISFNNQTIAKLGMVDFADYDYLEQYGENQFDAVNGATIIPFTGSVEQGVIETSNVNIVDEMVNLIAVTRQYESNQKMIQTVDSIMDKAVNTIGKV
ncbi:MAG: flagellar hook-basal body protein [Lachnospiraceae bacterium]|jgi:flagellar basal-body rod protein FlgG|nr:flagellar hook-basal body protein [Lachnospiraceae bacterium]